MSRHNRLYALAPAGSASKVALLRYAWHARRLALRGLGCVRHGRFRPPDSSSSRVVPTDVIRRSGALYDEWPRCALCDVLLETDDRGVTLCWYCQDMLRAWQREHWPEELLL